jgi:hypothetical protein
MNPNDAVCAIKVTRSASNMRQRIKRAPQKDPGRTADFFERLV